jgi:hypothetical protein
LAVENRTAAPKDLQQIVMDAVDAFAADGMQDDATLMIVTMR